MCLFKFPSIQSGKRDKILNSCRAFAFVSPPRVTLPPTTSSQWHELAFMPILGSTQMTLYFGTLTMSTYADDVDNDDDDDTNICYNIGKNTKKKCMWRGSEIFYNENWIRKVVEWTTRRKSSRAENEIKLYFFVYISRSSCHRLLSDLPKILWKFKGIFRWCLCTEK